jgi:hypothetical protein
MERDQLSAVAVTRLEEESLAVAEGSSAAQHHGCRPQLPGARIRSRVVGRGAVTSVLRRRW